jgi:flagellar basal body-associated protein FliL
MDNNQQNNNKKQKKNKLGFLFLFIPVVLSSAAAFSIDFFYPKLPTVDSQSISSTFQLNIVEQNNHNIKNIGLAVN